MRKISLCLILFIFLMTSVNASIISGRIYGPDFNLVKEVLVKVGTDSNVLSSMVSKDGTYSFDVKDGTYTIKAEVYDNGVKILEGEENVVISGKESEVDLIVLPSIDEGLNEFNVDTNIESKKNYSALIIGGIFLLILILFYLYKKGLFKLPKKKNKEDLSKDLKSLVKLIEKKGKRINQVDLRKELPYSEAKVSLMISDLESRGLIRRIKRGRGNILILK